METLNSNNFIFPLTVTVIPTDQDILIAKLRAALRSKDYEIGTLKSEIEDLEYRNKYLATKINNLHHELKANKTK